jgi:hypothetical protein
VTNPNYFWTKEQEDLLQESYSNGGLKTAIEKLPGMTKGQIATKASRMGITKPKPRLQNGFSIGGYSGSDSGPRELPLDGSFST